MRDTTQHKEQERAIRTDMLGGSDRGFTLRRRYETLTAWLCGLFLVALTASVQAGGNISTVAGQIGIADGGPATSAVLYEPNGIAFDGSGNLYIADSNHNVIREVNASTGNISTVAGNGTAGSSGNGGLATSAELDSPTGIAFDAAGDMYIADYGNNVIREVNTSGNISIFAGNGTAGYSGDTEQATNAELNSPYSLAFDTAGNLYIADVGNNRIRVVNNAGVINTYAGNGTAGSSGDGAAATSAELNQPYGVTVYASNLYISDLGNNRIREVNASTGDISTVAGNGTAGYSGDTESATSAELNAPDGVAFDGVGNMYIADLLNNVIREVNASSGNISTYAGNGTAGSSGDGAAATSAELDQPYGVSFSAGNLYIIDFGNNLIREVISGNITTFAGLRNPGDDGPATSAYMIDPSGTAYDAAGNLYIADYGNNRIREVNASTEDIRTVAGNGSEGYSGDGGQATSAELDGPNSVAFDAAGNLYIADLSNNVIRMVNTSGVISTVAGNGTPGSSGDGGAATSAELDITNGGGVAVFGGNLYIADYGNNRIRVVKSGVISTVAGNGTEGYSGDGGSATSAELDGPNSIAFDAAGGMYIADFDNDVIRKVNTSAVISTVAGNGSVGYTGDGGAATSAELDGPTGIAVDAAAQLYIADLDNNVIRMVDAAGNISTYAGTGTAGYSGDNGAATSADLNGPYAVGLDTAGNLYIADSGNNLVRRVSASGTSPTAPTITSATGGSGQVTLKWNAPPGGAVDYNIYQGTASGGESQTPIAVGITQTNALITGLTNGKTYYFVITASNAVGTSAISNEVSATPEASVAPPPAGSSSSGHHGGGGMISPLTVGLLMLGIAMRGMRIRHKRVILSNYEDLA